MNDRPTLLLEHHLKVLRLPTFLREYGKMAAQCAAEGVDHPDYLLRLSELELIDRHHRMVERRIKAVRFPTVKSLDTFDFLAIPSVNRQLVTQLSRCEYVDRKGLCTTTKDRRPNGQDIRRPRIREGHQPPEGPEESIHSWSPSIMG